MVGDAEALEAGPDRRLAQHQADARRRCAAAGRRRLVVQDAQAGRAREREDRGRGPLPQAAQVLAEPGLERPERAALEPLDEAADEADGVLEGQPRVALAPLGRASGAGRGRR